MARVALEAFYFKAWKTCSGAADESTRSNFLFLLSFYFSTECFLNSSESAYASSLFSTIYDEEFMSTDALEGTDPKVREAISFEFLAWLSPAMNADILFQISLADAFYPSISIILLSPA